MNKQFSSVFLRKSTFPIKFKQASNFCSKIWQRMRPVLSNSNHVIRVLLVHKLCRGHSSAFGHTIISTSFSASQSGALDRAATRRFSTASPARAFALSVAVWQWCVLMGNDSLIEPLHGLWVICFEGPRLTAARASPQQLRMKLTINHLITFTLWQFLSLATFFLNIWAQVRWQGRAF